LRKSFAIIRSIVRRRRLRDLMAHLRETGAWRSLNPSFTRRPLAVPAGARSGRAGDPSAANSFFVYRAKHSGYVQIANANM